MPPSLLDTSLQELLQQYHHHPIILRIYCSGTTRANKEQLPQIRYWQPLKLVLDPQPQPPPVQPWSPRTPRQSPSGLGRQRHASPAITI